MRSSRRPRSDAGPRLGNRNFPARGIPEARLLSPPGSKGFRRPAPGACRRGPRVLMMNRVRVRVRFRKRDDLRWISHHDLARTFERWLRRAGLPLRRSAGFHPKPKLSFPSALALGIAALDEVMEFELSEAVSVTTCARAWTAPPSAAWKSPVSRCWRRRGQSPGPPRHVRTAVPPACGPGLAAQIARLQAPAPYWYRPLAPTSRSISRPVSTSSNSVTASSAFACPPISPQRTSARGLGGVGPRRPGRRRLLPDAHSPSSLPPIRTTLTRKEETSRMRKKC